MEILKNIAADDAYTPAKAKPHVPKFSPMSVIDSDYALPGDEADVVAAGPATRNLMGAFDRVDGGAGDALMKKTTRPDSEELMSVALPAPLDPPARLLASPRSPPPRAPSSPKSSSSSRSWIK